MNNHEAVTCLDKAITDLSQLYESCDREIENRVWGILQTVCDTKKNLEKTHSQAEGDDDIAVILCSAADISRQLKFVTGLYQQSFDAAEVESSDFALACLIATLSHQLCKTIKSAENLT